MRPLPNGGLVTRLPRGGKTFPVRSRGHASTSWYLHCPYLKSPTPDHLLSADTHNLADGSGRMPSLPLGLDRLPNPAVGNVVVDDAAGLHGGVRGGRSHEPEACAAQTLREGRRFRRRRGLSGERGRGLVGVGAIRPEE